MLVQIKIVISVLALVKIIKMVVKKVKTQFNSHSLEDFVDKVEPQLNNHFLVVVVDLEVAVSMIINAEQEQVHRHLALRN